MKSNKEILDQFDNHKKISNSGLANQWDHIKECRAFYAGDYMSYKDVIRGRRNTIQEVSFNRVKPYVNSMVGFMAQNRRKPDYQAKLPDLQMQAALSEYLNGYSDYLRDNMNADQIETRQDLDMIIGGIGITDTATTLKTGMATRDPNGEVLVERVDPLHCGWDPEARETNILDSRWIYRAKDYDVEEAEELFNAEDEDFEVADPSDDVTYHYNGTGGIEDKIGYEWASPERKMVRVYFYQWFDVETFYRIENPVYTMNDRETAMMMAQDLQMVESAEGEEMFAFDPSAETLVITKDNRKTVKDIFELYGIKFDPVSEKRKVFYTAVISGKKVFSAFKSTSQQGFSMKFKTGDWDDVKKIWTGVVASLKEPQRYYNASLTKLLLIIASNSKGGVMYERSAVENIQEFEAKYAMHSAAIMVEDGALSGNKIVDKARPQLNTGYEAVLQLASDAMGQVSGIDESFFGVISGGNETAMLQRQRIKQAMTTMACYFDAVTLYAKEQARMMLSFMRLLAKSSNGTMFRTYDDDGNVVFERLSEDYFVDEYDIVIGEAPETPMQKEYYTQTLISLGQSMQAIGDPRYLQIYAAAIRYMPIPARDKNAITEILTGQQQIDPALVEQLQARIQQLEGEQSQVMTQKALADIQKSMAEAAKTAAETEKTFAETESVIEETEKKAIENDLMMNKPINEVNVTV